jgi:hypothetical protein
MSVIDGRLVCSARIVEGDGERMCHQPAEWNRIDVQPGQPVRVSYACEEHGKLYEDTLESHPGLRQYIKLIRMS